MLLGIAPLQLATPSDVSFLDNRRYMSLLAETRAGAVIVRADMVAQVPSGTQAIVTQNPYLGWAQVATLFYPPPPVTPGAHPSAVIAADARIDPTAEIGPFVVIGSKAEIGPRCRIGAHVVIGNGVSMQEDCRIGSHVSITHAVLGKRIVIFPGARIGQDGFGFAMGPAGFVGVPQLGHVILEDDVAIGANTTVDRGSAMNTVIGAGSRLDNLVQIGHNVRMGRCCVIVAQTGISGSTTLGDFIQVGGQAGIAGHLNIGSKVRIAAQSGVMNDVPDGVEMFGSPAQPAKVAFREIAVLRQMVKKRLKRDVDET